MTLFTILKSKVCTASRWAGKLNTLFFTINLCQSCCNFTKIGVLITTEERWGFANFGIQCIYQWQTVNGRHQNAQKYTTQYTTLIVLKFLTSTLNLPSHASHGLILRRSWGNGWKNRKNPRTRTHTFLYSHLMSDLMRPLVNRYSHLLMPLSVSPLAGLQQPHRWQREWAQLCKCNLRHYYARCPSCCNPPYFQALGPPHSMLACILWHL